MAASGVRESLSQAYTAIADRLKAESERLVASKCAKD
jgi:hypothetical protein